MDAGAALLGAIASVHAAAREGTGAVTAAVEQQRSRLLEAVPDDEARRAVEAALAEHGAVALETARVLEEARQARQDFETVVDAAPEAIALYAPDGGLVIANRWARDRYLGHVGRVPRDLAEVRALVGARTPDGSPAAEMPAERALRGESVEEELIFSDGRRLFVVAAPVRDASGHITGAVSVSRDVTELHEAIADRARLDGAIKTVRRVAHELNNKLSLVTGYGELLPRLDNAGAANAAREMARGADEAAEVLSRLQRIVRFAETDVGGVTLLDIDAAQGDEDFPHQPP